MPLLRPCPPLAAALLALALSSAGCTIGPQAGGPDQSAADREARIQAALTKVERAAQLTKDGRKAEALAELEAAVRTYDEFAAAWLNLGAAYMDARRNREALDALERAANLAPTDPRPLHNMGVLWQNQSFLDDAARFFDQALERDPYFRDSLRESIRVDQLRERRDSKTADRIRRALLVETDPVWREFLLRQKQLTDDQVVEPSGSVGR